MARGHEGRPVPRRLYPVNKEDCVHQEEHCHDGTEDGYSLVETLLKQLVHLRQEKQNQPSDSNEEGVNVSFSGPLASLAPHEVLGNIDVSVLVSVELEPGDTVNDGVDDTACANDEGHHGNEEPDLGFKQNDPDILEHRQQNDQDNEEGDVLNQDGAEGEDQLHVRVQALVEEFQDGLGLANLIGPHQPLVLFLEELLSFQAFLLL